MAIIDSGATETFLPLWIAEVLGLELENETDIRFVDRNGKGYESKVTLIIELEHKRKVELSVPCVILDKMESESGEVILGRAGFFHVFEITFREFKKEVVLKYVGGRNTP